MKERTAAAGALLLAEFLIALAGGWELCLPFDSAQNLREYSMGRLHGEGTQGGTDGRGAEDA